MKKLLLFLAIIASVSICLPKQLASAEPEPEPCQYYIFNCPNGSQHTALVCDFADYTNWYYILCGACPD